MDRSYFPFIKFTKLWLTISVLAIFGSIGALFYFGLSLGIDFTGGTLMEVHFTGEKDIGFMRDIIQDKNDEYTKTIEVVAVVENENSPKVLSSGTTAEAEKDNLDLSPIVVEKDSETILKKEITSSDILSVLSTVNADLGDPLIVKTGENGFIIRMKEIDEITHTEIKKKFAEKLGVFEETRIHTIGPVVGDTLKQKALLSVSIAIIGIIFFIAYSFRKVPKKVSPWKFSLTAIIALVHDIIITLGVFSVFSHFLGYEANALFITALLTILGYSVNDTIVVFDRIRENLKYQERGESFADVANKSLNQTISRSVNTSLTTLITLLALFFFGGETIKFFVLTLIIGFVSGTYSSIFIASPLLVMFRKK